MADHKLITQDLSATILNRTMPGITVWNRLEGRPRAPQFDRALRAEVRDPLWMLTRQWQLGEFRGDDAGSPFLAKVHLETSPMRKYQCADGPVEGVDPTVPLEARVEMRPVATKQGGCEVSLDIRLMLGRQWLKLIGPLAPLAVGQFITAYPVHDPDPTVAADFPICAHPEAWANFAAATGRAMDGLKLLEHLAKQPGNRASDGITALAGLKTQADAIAKRFIAWYRRLILQPDGPDAWLPERLEYQFAVSAAKGGGEKVLAAEQYYHGHLDWYAFDVDPTRAELGDAPIGKPERTSLTMLPTPIKFNGMPNTRWWKFEDGLTNFGDVKPDTTDLAKLLLIEFGLVYANDWFLVPFTLPAGSVATIKGMAVTNVFGERVWIEAAGRGDDDDWQRWAMFLLSTKGKGHEPADLSLVVPPVAQQSLESRPCEEVLLVRDEMANMVWAVEKEITLPSGERKSGREAADQIRALYERDLERRLGAPPEPLPAAPDAKIRYRIMTSVPENWIPMIPVHVDDDNREVQLQRAAMPRVLIGDPAKPEPVRPRTTLMRAGLDPGPAVKYLLHEEEVPRSGIRVVQGFERCRGRDGRACVWLGVRKQTGHGEGSSGLAFDRLEDLPRA